MKRFKAFCVLLILLLTMTSSSYALQQKQNDSVGKHSFIINEEVAKSENITIENPIVEVNNEETKQLTENGIIISNQGIAKKATVAEEVYKQNTLSTDSTVTISSTVADLSMGSLTAEVQPFEVGETANLEFELANYGGTTALNTYVYVTIDDDYVGGLNIGSILAGYIYTFPLTINGLAEGTHEIMLSASSSSIEADYSNNTISEDFVWQGVPDLVAKTFDTVSGYTSFVEGESVAFTFSVKNEGTGIAEGIQNYLLINGQQFAILSYPSLDVGSTLTCSFSLTFYSPGYYTLQLYVNKDHSIVESNYNNNTQTKAVTILESVLDVPEYTQQPYDSICWATSAAMVISYFLDDTTNRNVEIAQDLYGQEDFNRGIGDISIMEDYVQDYTSENGSVQNNALSYTSVKYQVNHDGPIISVITWTGSNSAHAEVIKGYNLEYDYVVYNDPWDGLGHAASYDYYLENDDWDWTHSIFWR